MSSNCLTELPNLLQKSTLAVIPCKLRAFHCIPDVAMSSKTHRHCFLSPAAWRPRLAQRRGNKSTKTLMAGSPGGSAERIRLPMQETWVRSLGREDHTCRGATKPVHPNYQLCDLQPGSCNYCRLHTPEPVVCSERNQHRRGSQRET